MPDGSFELRPERAVAADLTNAELWRRTYRHMLDIEIKLDKVIELLTTPPESV